MFKKSTLEKLSIFTTILKNTWVVWTLAFFILYVKTKNKNKDLTDIITDLTGREDPKDPSNILLEKSNAYRILRALFPYIFR